MRSLTCLCAVSFFPILLGCAEPPPGRSAAPPAPVLVAVAGKKTVPIRVHTIGTVEAVARVAVRPRVGGQLTGVYFEEGDDVKKGQKLFTIDPRPYDVAVEQAEANVARSTAVLLGAELDLKRAELAKNSRAGAAIEYDAAATAVATARAAVAADRVAVAAAKLQAEFTTITAPFDGRAGELLVDRDNLVEANGIDPLVVINQIDPISVTFTLPERQLPVVVEARGRGPVEVEARLRAGGRVVAGELSFIDNAADTPSGTVQFKAVFENASRDLWPGLFVRVTLTLGDRPGSVVVPSAALQSGQMGHYVYVVTPESKAELRPVSVAFEADGEAVIAAGLDGGETVVVEGQLRLARGTEVQAKPWAGRPGAPAAPPIPVVSKGAE